MPHIKYLRTHLHHISIIVNTMYIQIIMQCTNPRCQSQMFAHTNTLDIPFSERSSLKYNSCPELMNKHLRMTAKARTALPNTRDGTRDWEVVVEGVGVG